MLMLFYMSVHKKLLNRDFLFFNTVLVTYILVFNHSFIVCRNMQVSFWKLTVVYYRYNSNIMVYLLSHDDGEDNEEQVKERDRAGEENRVIRDFMT